MPDWLPDESRDPRHGGGVCINLSRYAVSAPSLLEFLYDKLGEKDAPIERLWVELTDASAIRDLQSAAGLMEEVRALGCRLRLGDFGSGPSSFQFMRSLPVDLIKIDSAFTGQLAANQTDQAMVRSMVDMAHYMEREVIASQVESREVLDMLRQLGVDYAQGFRSEEHTSELQSRENLVCRLLLEKKKKK